MLANELGAGLYLALCVCVRAHTGMPSHLYAKLRLSL